MIHRARQGRQASGKSALEWLFPLRSRRLWVVARFVGVLASFALALSAAPAAALAGGGGGGNECGIGWFGGSSCEQCDFGFGCESVSFSIVKEQRIQGESRYTTSKLKAEFGQKIEYKITVTNTGSSTINLGPLSDAACTNISPSGGTALKANESETFTCDHVLSQGDHTPYTNVASIEGCLKSYEKQYPCGHGYGQQQGTPCKVKESNKVEVEVEVESASFSLKKEQRIKGEGTGYTTAKLKAKVGQTVEYLISAENTGSSSITIGSLTDAKCTNIQPSGSFELAPKAQKTFTCEHVLAEGDKPIYTNVASIEGCLKSHEMEYPCGHGYGKQPGTSCKVKESNVVEVEVESESALFSIKKEQRIAGEGTGYTTEKLKAKIGQTVEYLITVENTGSSSITIGSLTDAKCTNVQPSGSFELAPKAQKTFTCEHVLAEGDKPVYTNTASIEGCLKSHEKEYPCGHGYGKQPGTTCKVKESNTVEVEVEEAAHPAFEIKKEQRIAGEAGFTPAKLSSEVGKKVEYKVTVKNTGNTTLKFSVLKDVKCTGVTPAGETTLKAGEEETFSCEHLLAEGDENPYKNTASITGGGVEKTSNTVEVEIKKPNFEVIKEQRLKGETNYTTVLLHGSVGETVEYKITVKNTGNTTIKFEALKDSKCTNFVPALAAFELGPGASQVYTCEHVLVEGDGPIYQNAAAVKGGEKEKESPPVEVEVKETHEFEIKKEQRIAGEAGFTPAKLSSEVGKKVEYKVTVKNTGNTTLKFSVLKDVKCTGVTPAGETTLKAGEEETFSCEHLLAEGDENPYKNTASITGGGVEKTSNTVEVEIKKPNFEVIKEQRLKGETNYTTVLLHGSVGETVEYKITVKNTGNTTIKFEALKDSKCTNFVPALAAFELGPGASQVYTCEHVLVEGDGPIYQNAAAVKGGEKEKESPPVEVEVKETHEFEIKKEQRIAGEAGFTPAKLSSEVGKKVEYKVTVKNTGNTTLKFSVLKDVKCTGVTPAGETTLKAGEEETFSCEHLLAEGDENPYKNTASITGGGVEKTSNTVEVEIKKPNFEVIKEQRLKGETNYTTVLLHGSVGETVEYKITVKNTGNTTIKFEALKDSKCTNFVPALAAFELGPGASQVYTCEHVLVEGDGPIYQNAAAVKGGEKEKESPPVEVEVKETHEFEIKKEQRIAGEAGFTPAKLSSEVGKKVEYKVTVKNTGNTTLKFSVLKDVKCTGVTPAGETTLKAGEEETFSCEHLLAEGDENPYKNTASITGGGVEKTSNTVEVEIKKPNFEVIKEQRLKGETNYTTVLLHGSVGETVEYKITVKNTGNTTIKFEALKDSKCTNFVPALAAFELGPGASQVYTCEHVLVEGDGPIYQNAAAVKGGEKEKESPPVEVEVKETHEFEIKKEQRIAGEAGFTPAKLSSEVGKKVEYKVTVKNTGNTTLKFSVLKDVKCTGVTPAGETTLKAGEEETFSCEHLLAEGDENPYKNTASITGGGVEKTSNTVEVEIKKPNFEVIKEQRLKGETNYTTVLLHGSVGETVEYKITVKNTGNTTIKFEALKDSKCTNFVPALAAFELGPGASQVYTCEHVLVEGDGPIYQNAAAVKGGEKEKESPPVEVEVKETHEFEIKKEQRIAGEAGFTPAKLSSEVGKKVEYKVTVKNTGNTTLKFSVLKDVKCTGVTPAGETTLKAGEEETFSCEHLLAEGDENPYKNTASITGGGVEKTSNTVEVEIKKPYTPTTPTTPTTVTPTPKQQVAAVCEISESAVSLRGVAGSKRRPFEVSVPSLGIKEITFYVDGKKLKTVTAAHAVKGQFVVTINPAKYKYGAHKVSIKTVMTNAACAKIARSGVFVRARPAAVKPKFTG